MAKEKSKNISETGQLLMTVENLYTKCEQMPNIFPSTNNYKKWETLKNFDNTSQSGEKAITQLEIIIQQIANFKKLKRLYIEKQRQVQRDEKLTAKK